MGTIYKVDLDISSFRKAVKHLRERLYFLDKIELLPKKYITKVELVLKNNYSAKIYFSKIPKDENNIIIIQAILGDDYKRLAITYRDFNMGIKNYNRLFDIKRYPDGSYKYSETLDITKKVFESG